MVTSRRQVRATRGRATAGAVLLDVEGTTTPIGFVTNALFPYARRHLRSYLRAHRGGADHESLVAQIREEHASASAAGEALPPWPDSLADARDSAIAGYVEWLMDRDRKSTTLKELQGRIWEDGYARGALIGRVFPDVRPALQRWREQSVEIAIFSSGSALAQQLLFRHSSDGDLARFIGWHFDTRVGAKTDPASYRRIAAAIGVPARKCTFLSDTTSELDAARREHMQVRLVVRPGNVPAAPCHVFATIHTFDELTLE